LEGHPVLHRDSTAQRLHPLDVAIGDGFAVIEEPVQAVKRNLSIHFFINLQCSLDRLVVCRVQAKRPAILYKMPDHRFQLALHDGEHVRPWHKEVFEICAGKYEHFPGAVDAIEIIAVSVLSHFGPALKVAQFLFRFLREEVVSKPEGKFSISVQLVHNAVVVGIILKSAARINDTGDSKTVQFAEKLP
jgi:hypothetical protein